MGIGRPVEGMDSADYVLGRFGREEEECLGLMLERGILAIETIINDGMAAAMNLLNKKRD
jgi:PTH1 family peptidyl-tRNA hydrolase